MLSIISGYREPHRVSSRLRILVAELEFRRAASPIDRLIVSDQRNLGFRMKGGEGAGDAWGNARVAMRIRIGAHDARRCLEEIYVAGL